MCVCGWRGRGVRGAVCVCVCVYEYMFECDVVVLCIWFDRRVLLRVLLVLSCTILYMEMWSFLSSLVRVCLCVAFRMVGTFLFLDACDLEELLLLGDTMHGLFDERGQQLSLNQAFSFLPPPLLYALPNNTLSIDTLHSQLNQHVTNLILFLKHTH